MPFFSKLRDVWEQAWFYPRVGLRNKMTLIVIVGTISLISIFAYLGTAALNENIQHSLEERTVVAQTAARHVDYVLASVEHELIQAAAQDGLGDPARRMETLAAIYARVDFFGHQLFITDRSGRVIATYPPISTEPSLASVRAVQLALQGQAFAVSRFAHSLTIGNLPLAVTPLRDAIGQVNGTLIIGLDPNSPNLGIFTNPIGLGGSGYMDLIDNEGVILASTQFQRVGQFSDHNTTLTRMIEAQRASVSRCHNCHTLTEAASPRSEMLAFAPVMRAPWGVTVRQDEEEVLQTARELQSRIFGLGILALGGALLLVYFTTRSVILPVQELTTATQRIAAGDLDTQIQAHSQDEIGVLASSFDSMRSQLKQSIAEIQAWNRELDARVQERTAALAAAQREIQKSHDHLQTIIDSLGDELLVIDPDFRIVRVNAVAQRHHGNGTPIVGALCYDVTHAGCPCQSPDRECPVPTVLKTAQPLRVTHLHCSHGQPRYMEVTASPLVDSEGQVSGIVELLRDVTEQKKLEETLLKRNRELSAVNAIARVVGQSLKLDECLQSALSEVQRIAQVEIGSIFLLEGEDRTLKLHVCCGMSEQSAEATGRMALTDTACGGVLQIGEPVVVQNVSQTTRASYGALQREALSSLVHVPLMAKGKPLGTLCLGSRTPYEFTDEEISLLGAIGNQIAIAVENAQLYAELSRKEQLRGELLHRVILVQEDERKRIARELHDETSQTLSALLFNLDAASQIADWQHLQTYIEKMRRLTVSTIDGIHKIILDLRPTMLDQLGLVAALRWYAETRLADSETRIQVTEHGVPRRLANVIETALFRTTQEAINNVARHAGARHLTIDFDFQAEQTDVRVKDDGVGFDVKQVIISPDSQCGFGLMSMHERMSAVGGEFFIDSVLNQGTSILLRVPIPGDADGTDSSACR